MPLCLCVIVLDESTAENQPQEEPLFCSLVSIGSATDVARRAASLDRVVAILDRVAETLDQVAATFDRTEPWLSVGLI